MATPPAPTAPRCTRSRCSAARLALAEAALEAPATSPPRSSTFARRALRGPGLRARRSRAPHGACARARRRSPTPSAPGAALELDPTYAEAFDRAEALAVEAAVGGPASASISEPGEAAPPTLRARRPARRRTARSRARTPPPRPRPRWPPASRRARAALIAALEREPSDLTVARDLSRVAEKLGRFDEYVQLGELCADAIAAYDPLARGGWYRHFAEVLRGRLGGPIARR